MSTGSKSHNERFRVFIERKVVMASKIYAIMVMTDIKKDEKTGCPDFGCTRLVGWYPDFIRASSAVTENMLDINETCYDYALIEECSSGIYHPAEQRWWYEFDRESGEYKQIDEPECIKRFCGFTFG